VADNQNTPYDEKMRSVYLTRAKGIAQVCLNRINNG
jgi:hypothetical protein